MVAIFLRALVEASPPAILSFVKIRAATWNIEGGGGTDENFEGAVDFLARNPVDVLVVTEAQWRRQWWQRKAGRLKYMERSMRSEGARMIGRLATAPGTTCHIATFYNG